MSEKILVGGQDDERILEALNAAEEEFRKEFWGADDAQMDAASLVDGRSTYIGNTINVLKASGATAENIKSTIFNANVYTAADFIETSAVALAEVESQVSNQFAEVFSSKEISATLESGSGLAFFSGGVEAKYGASDKLTSSALFHNSIASVQTEKHVLNASYLFPEEMREITKPNILKHLDASNISPESIFEAYGTHIITEVSIGGFIQVTGVYRSSESISKADFSAAVKFACAYVSAEAKTAMTSEQKRILSNTHMAARSYGGDVSITVGALSIEDIPKTFKAWGASIRDKKEQVLAKVYSYMPIWELAQKETRKKELRKYFIALAQDKYKGLADYFTLKPSRPPVSVVIEVSPGMKDVMPSAYWVPLNSETIGITLPKVTPNTTFIMKHHDDDTVTFFHKETKKYMSVHYNSNVPGLYGKDASQLWIFGEIVEERQKFRLIPSGNKVKIQSVKNNLFIKGKVVPFKWPLLNYFADASEANAELFEIKKLN